MLFNFCQGLLFVLPIWRPHRNSNATLLSIFFFAFTFKGSKVLYERYWVQLVYHKTYTEEQASNYDGQKKISKSRKEFDRESLVNIILNNLLVVCKHY